jgi:hypothetical protein
MKHLFATILLALPLTAWAATATLTWTPPANKANVAGYQVRYGTAPGDRSNSIDVVGATSSTATVPNLDNGQTYYFAVRSANATKTAFSIDSNEVSASAALAPPTSTKVTITVTAE